MEYLLIAAVAYVLFCKAWPYYLYPNYFRHSKIEDYPELISLARALRATTKDETLENVYKYIERTYSGTAASTFPRNWFTVFEIGDFSTRRLLGRPRFLWCHTQNRLMKSLLVQTDQFSADEIRIEHRYWTSLFIHQWISIQTDDFTFTIDPYYDRFSRDARHR